MIKLPLISNLSKLSLVKKISLGTGLIVILAAISVFALWPSSETQWTDQPVMLRILKGNVDIYDVRGGALIGTADETWLSNGNYLDVKQDSSVLLQYFDGSDVMIEGSAEVIVERSQSLDKEDLAAGREIVINALRGKITISAMQQTKPDSLFEVRTPNSVGVVAGTKFRVLIDGEMGATWETNQGIVRVGAITWDSEMMAVAALIPLHAKEAITIPPLPEEWQANEDLVKQLVEIVTDLARKSVAEGNSDIEVNGALLVEMDTRTDTAVFRFNKVVVPEFSPETTPELPLAYQKVDNLLLARLIPSLIEGLSTLTTEWFMPVLPVPSIWIEPTPAVKRTNPPTYLYSISNMAKPLAVALNPNGQRISITESAGDRVTRVFDHDGNELTILTPPDTVPAGRSPSYVAIDRMGITYVSDRLRQVIDIYDVDGTYLGNFASLNNLDISWSPLGLAFDSIGNLYVTDVTDLRHRILVFDKEGKLKLEFGRKGDGEGEFSFPNDIAIDSSGRIYVSDSNNYRIQIFDSKGNFLGLLTSVGGSIGFPRGLEIEGDYLYTVDTFGHTVHVFNLSDGIKPVFTFGDLGLGDGQFNFPNDMDIDSTGRIYVTDRENNRVQVWGY